MMNKLLVIPLLIMFFILIYGVVSTNETYEGEIDEYDSFESVNITGTEEEQITVEIPESETTFDLFSFEGVLLILTVAVGVGIASGIGILGSGLSDTSQKMLFSVILFGGIWACVSVFAYSFFVVTIFMQFIYLGITMMYVIGMGIQMTTGE